MPSYCSAVAVNQEAGGPHGSDKEAGGVAGNVTWTLQLSI